MRFEAETQTLRDLADRRGARLDLLEAENACLRERCRALQEASDRDAPRVRDYEEVDLERRQLQQQVSELRCQLLDSQQRLQVAEADAQALLSKLADKFDAELLQQMPDGKRPAWLEPIERRLEEAQLLLQQARDDEVAALAVSHRAREEAADCALQVAAEREESERLQRRLVETHMRLDQSLERSAVLSDAVDEAERKSASDLAVLRQRMLEDQQEAMDSELEGWRIKVARLEEDAARREDELVSLSQLRAVVENLEASGSLSSLTRSLSALNRVADADQSTLDTTCGSFVPQLKSAPAA